MCYAARGHRFFKLKMVKESVQNALLFIQPLSALVNDSASSRDIHFASLDT